ncbi:MAG: carbohydrate ABC transporter permease [Chloroflexia bacterium]|jgi:putative aldouronate transport system permease protein|nr:carbohydrate ABC transporter permease [Chloroflexia bacterium]
MAVPTEATADRSDAGRLTDAERGSAERSFGVLNIVFMTLLAAVMIIPFINVLAVAFSSNLTSIDAGIKLWPSEWSVEGFRTVWVNVGLQQAFINSVIVTTIGTFFHVLLAAFAGFVLIQRNLPGKRLMILFIIVTMAIPGELIMIPLFIVNRTLGLLDTLTALVFSGLISGFSILLLRNFFLSVPYDLWESAKIDGAGDFHIFRSIYLPLSQAGLATVGLFELVGRWNQFLPVVLYISDTSKYTLQVALQSLVQPEMATSGTSMVTPNVQMAGIVIAILPLIALYPFMQRYFVQGITLGSVKE